MSDVPPDSDETRPSAHLLHALTCGTWAVTDYIDPERGLLEIVARTGERPGDTVDGGPEIRRANRLCVEALDEWAGNIPERFELDLLNHVEGLPDEVFITCDDLECTLPAQTERETDDLIVFSRDAEHGLVMSALIEIEALQIAPELLAQRRADIEERRRALARGRCP